MQGRIEGHVAIEGRILIEPEGVVVANAEAVELTVRGKVGGDINAAERVVLSSTATVVGNLRAPRIVFEDGVRFRGHIDTVLQARPGLIGQDNA